MGGGMQTEDMQLLLADAHTCSRIGLCEVLTTAGFAILAEAECYDDCLQYLASQPPPLLLMACNLLPKAPIGCIPIM